MKKYYDYWDPSPILAPFNEVNHTPKILKKLNKILNNSNYSSLNHVDVGCGNGKLTVKIAKNFKKTLGIDVSSKGISLAKKLKSKNVKFKNYSLESLFKTKQKFDFVTSIETIEHQYDPFIFIQHLEAIISKNGYLLISTPYHGYIKNLMISILNLNDRHYTSLWRHGHIKFFSINTFKQLLSVSNVKLKIDKNLIFIS